MMENKHTLDHLIALAKQQEPLLPNKRAHEIINNAPTKAFPGKQLVNFIQKHFKLLIMSTIVSIFIGSVLWLQTNTSQTTSIQTQKQSSKQPALLTTSAGTSTKALHEGNLSTAKSTVKPPFTASSRIKDPVKIDTLIRRRITSQNNPSISGEENMLELSLSEFYRLGFNKINDSSFYYGNLSPDDFWVNQIFKCKGNITNISVSNWEDREKNNITGKGWPITVNDFYPVFITQRYLPKPIKYMPCNYKKVPKPNGWYWQIKDDTLQKQKENKFEIMNDTLVPVTLSLTDKSKLTNSDIILSSIISKQLYWFNPTRSFYERLPERYKENTRAFYENAKALKHRIADEVNIVKYQSLDIGSKVDPINLNKEQLKKLGFHLTDDGLEYNNGEHPNLNISVTKQVTGAWSTAKPKDTTFLNFYPFYVSTVDGSIPFSYQTKITTKTRYSDGRPSDSTTFEIGGDTKDFLRLTNRLVPILVKKKYFEAAKAIESDLIFWFTPTEALFDSLPKPIGEEVRKEYHALLFKDNPNITLEQKRQITSGCKYFEECQLTFDGLTDMFVFPNPAADIVNVQIELAEPTNCNIILYDMGGRFLKTIKGKSLITAGKHNFSLSITDIPSGIYIIAIRDDHRNMKSQRFIKQ